MVVGPRFNPPGSTEGVAAMGRNSRAGASGQKTEVTYLKPHERSGHDISLRVEIDPGVSIEEFECKTHKIDSERPTADKLIATLAAGDRVPNRDFVLRYRVTGGQVKGGLLTHKDERGGFFTLMLYPPAQINALARQPMEMVFVLDCSGSMSGRPIAQAKQAIREAFKLLQPQDSFQLINFSTSASQLGPKPLVATAANIQYGLAYLEALNSDGPTMMIEGIKAALDFPHDPERLRYVCFLTDGYIGNEAEIIAAVQDKLGPARIFSFGVGTAVNRYLLDSMAKVGRGAVAYLLPQTESAPVIEEFFARISHPALSDLRIDWAGLNVREVYPKVMPDLYAGRPVILTGRYAGELPGSVRVSARNGGGNVEFAAPILREEGAATTALPSIWARGKIADLSFSRAGDLAAQIKQTALDYSLLSQFTAFVAVDSTRRTAGEEGVTVRQAVPVPEGVKYSTTVGRD
jgi:Ca-activated chloride channel family protein